MPVIELLSVPISVTDEKVIETKIILEKYEILKRALGICELSGYRGYVSRIPRVVELIEAVNPRFPQDSFDVLTLVGFLNGNLMMHLDEFTILKSLMPEGGHYRCIINGTHQRLALTFQRSPKNGCYSEIIFRGPDGSLAFPLELEINRYQNMDVEDNHSDECIIAGDDGTCNCEASIEHTAHFIIPQWGELQVKYLRSFIAENIIT